MNKGLLIPGPPLAKSAVCHVATAGHEQSLGICVEMGERDSSSRLNLSVIGRTIGPLPAREQSKMMYLCGAWSSASAVARVP